MNRRTAACVVGVFALAMAHGQSMPTHPDPTPDQGAIATPGNPATTALSRTPAALAANPSSTPPVASPASPLPSPQAIASPPADVAQKACWPELNQPDAFSSPTRMMFKVVYLDDKSPVVDFASGPSHTRVIALPDYTKPYSITFRMVFQGFRTTVLVPSVAILDKNFCVLQDKGELRFEPAYAAFSQTINEDSLFDIASAEPKYIVVYTDERHLGEIVKLTRSTGIFTSHSKFSRAGLGYFSYHQDWGQSQ